MGICFFSTPVHMVLCGISYVLVENRECIVSTLLTYMGVGILLVCYFVAKNSMIAYTLP